MKPMMQGAVVAAVDFPSHSPVVIEHAALQAVQDGRPLVLVHAVDPATVGDSADDWVKEGDNGLRDSAVSLRERFPALEVSTLVMRGPVVPKLVQATKGAHVLVVGARGAGGFADLLLGSVAAQICAQVRCPVLLVRHPLRDDRSPAQWAAGPVMFGVDGSTDSASTLALALSEAAARATSLTAITVCIWPGIARPDVRGAWSSEESRRRLQADENAERLLNSVLALSPDSFAEIAIKRVVADGVNVAQTLLETTARLDASLLVVGSQSGGTRRGHFVGSVAEQLAHHADLPLLIVPHDRSGSTVSG
jgi:nucleotide-binding universal stress UspA family protein